ncbi:MAG: hypothetical protein LC620_00695 [Halobacteriales archaeon]|nr:hypothetical protein [Halobacteriales archaeon]
MGHGGPHPLGPQPPRQDGTHDEGRGPRPLGHPIGASGARVLLTLAYELRRRGGGRGLATLCLGGGNAVSALIRVPTR